MTGILDRVNRFLPLIAVALIGVMTWQQLKSDMARIDARLQEHIMGFDHDRWFSVSGVEHPTLRLVLEREAERSAAAARKALEVAISRERASWAAFFRANPDKGLIAPKFEEPRPEEQ